MDAKLAKLIEILRDEGQISPAELARRLDVSVRTVRTYVSRANDLLARTDAQGGDGARPMVASRPEGDSSSSRGRIEMRSSSVYRLEGVDPSRIDELLGRSGSEGSHAGEAVPATSEQRVAYLMNDLLYRTGWITIDDLAQILYVSRVTVSDELKEVERRLARFDLVLERRPRYGIRVAGPELKRRLCLAAVAASGHSAASDASLASSEVVTVIDECVREATRRNNFQVNALAHQNLIVHIAVAVARIREGCYVPMPEEQLDRIRSTHEFSVARDVAALVEARFGVALPEEEVAYIAIHLAGRQRLYFSADAPENDLVISDEVWDVVARMIEHVWTVFRFDFRDDLELRMNLAQHVTPLAVRLRFHMRMDNPLLSDIKNRYPLAWTMAVEASAVLADAYDAQLSDEEIGYVALAFELALERQKGGPSRKNILIVCASGAGSARLLENRYRREFGAYLDRIETCDVGGVDAVDLTDIDYVFTTVPLAHPLPVPVREVGFFLDEGDLHLVREALEVSPRPQGVESYFDERLFFSHLVAQDKKGAIDRLCALVAERREVPEGFARLVWEREDAAPTAFGNNVSMPHPARPCTPDTFVAVAILDRPVLWAPEVWVQAIFLVSISTSAEKNLQGFYDRISRLLLSKEDIQTLISQRDFTILLELVNR